MVTKTFAEQERAEMKTRLQRIHALASTPTRVAIITHQELLALLQEIRELTEEI